MVDDLLSLSPDEQEARSIRYVLGLRLALLTSGNWAIYYGDRVEIQSCLDEGWLRSCGEDERRERETMDMDYHIHREGLLLSDTGAMREQLARVSIDDMGL